MGAAPAELVGGGAATLALARAMQPPRLLPVIFTSKYSCDFCSCITASQVLSSCAGG